MMISFAATPPPAYGADDPGILERQDNYCICCAKSFGFMPEAPESSGGFSACEGCPDFPDCAFWSESIYSNGSFEPRVSFSYFDTSIFGEGGFAINGKRSRHIATVKPLMIVLEGDPSAVITDGRTGEPADIESIAIDADGKLYEMDWETGCAFRTLSYTISGKVRYNPEIAAHCDCYGSLDDLLTDVYRAPW